MKSKSIQLFAFDQKHNLQYQGNCKLQIDRLSSILLVEPEHEEYKIKSSKFECGFAMNKNVLFIVAEQELNDFVLIFDDEERCKKVYDLILADKASNDVKEDMLLNRFLVPLCKGFTQNGEAALKLKEVVLQLIAKEKYEKEKNSTTAMNNASNFPCSLNAAPLTCGGAVVESSDTFDNHGKQLFTVGKRRYSQLNTISNSPGNGYIPKQTRTYSQTVNRGSYKLIHIKSGMYIRQRLFIFTNAAKTECYQYFWSQQRKLYYCIGCEVQRKDVTAIFDKDENGADCINMEEKYHICFPLQYTTENYTIILKKPDYEIVKNSSAIFEMILIIFDENDKTRCWEFQADYTRPLFICCKCNNFSVKLVNNNSKNEFVELKSAGHKCESIPYQPNSYSLDLSTDFEVQTYIKNGQEKKRLIIFDKTDQTLCHVYSALNGLFMCYSCHLKGIQVSAKVLRAPNGEEYVMLSKMKHICKLRVYSELPPKLIILRPPDFEYMDNTENGTPKLFIFDSTDRSLCYKFSFAKGTKQKYYCQGCEYKKKKHEAVRVVSVYLCKNENGKYYLQSNDSKHACEPKKYEPEKYAKKEIHKCYNFFFFRRQNYPKTVNIAIYHPEDNALCFLLNYIPSTSRFVCNSCKSKGNYAFIRRIEKDEDGKEYFNHNYRKHICQPVNVSSICGPEFVILNRDEIDLEQKEKKKREIDESKIIKSEHFQLRPNQRGTPNASLVIYHSEDQNVGYKYYYRSDKKCYTCCKSSCCASAKLQIQENGEIYVIMGKAEHKCEPVNFMKT